MKNICIILSLALLMECLPVYGFDSNTSDSSNVTNVIEANKIDTMESVVSAEDSLKVRKTNVEKQELRKEKKKALIGLAVIGTIFLFFGV